jgi:hypothetical protein
VTNLQARALPDQVDLGIDVRRFSRRKAGRLGLGIAAPVAAALLLASCALLWAKARLWSATHRPW